MRHSSFSRSTRNRLQKLTAFLTAVAIIAGFLPLGAVKVFADVQPTETYPYLFEIWTDGKGTVSFDKNTYPESEVSDDGKSIVALSASKSFTVTATPEENEFLDEVVICIDDNPENDIHLTQAQNYSNESCGVSYSEGNLTFEIKDDRTEYRGILIFFSGRYQEDVIEEDYILNEPQTIEGGNGARIRNCTVTLNADLTIQAGGNLILEGTASINGVGHIKPVLGASLSFEGGASAPEGITLYDSDGTTELTGSFDQWEEFSWDGSKWVKPAPPSSEKRIESDFTVNENKGINGGESWRIVGSKLTIAEGATLTVNAGGNLILEGEDAQIENFSAVTFVEGASLSFEDGANAPSGVTLYDGDGTTIMNGLFDGYEEFRLDNGKWVRNMPPPANETRIESDFTVNENTEINNGESWRIVGCKLTIAEGATLTANAGGNLILEGEDAQIENFSAVTFVEGASFSFEGGANAPSGVTLYDGDGITKIDGPFDVWEEFVKDNGKWVRVMQGPGPSNETLINTDTPLEEDKVILAGESWKIDRCVLTLNCKLTIENGGELFLDGSGAAIDVVDNFEPLEGAYLNIGNGADAPANITLYAEDGTTEMNISTYQNWERFRYDGTKWVREVGPSDKYFYDQPATITEDIVVEADESMRVVGCTVTLDSTGSITVKNNGKLILDGSEASITGFGDIDFKDGAILAFQSGANVPAGITLYDEDGTEMTDTSFQQWEQFLWDATAGKWIHDDSQPKASFPGATNFDDTNAANGTIVIEYEHGEVTVVAKDNSTVFSAKKDANGVVVVKCDGSIEITAAPDPDYSSKIKIGGNEVADTYTLIQNLGSGMEIEVTFTGPSFILEVGGNVSSDKPVEDETTKTVTVECDHGKVVVSGYANLLDIEAVTPGGSSIPGAYTLKIEGDAFNIKFIPNTGYIYGIREDGTIIYDDDGELSYTGISRDNQIKFEAMFEQVPLLKIAEGYTYKTQTGEMDFGNGNIVTIQGDTKPSNPQQFNETYADVSFSITTGEGYSCFVSFEDAMGNMSADEYVTGNTYTLSKNKLLSLPDGNRNNTITFTFVQLTSDQMAKVTLNGEATLNGDYYYVAYIDNLKGIQLGTVKIPKDSIESYSYADAKSTFTIKQAVSSLELTITPNSGYTPNLVEYGPAYGEGQTVTGEWSRELTLTKNNGTYSYSLSVNPQSTEPINLRFSFNNTQLIKSTVTYTYTGEPASIAIGGNEIPSGVLTNKEVIYKTPLVPDSDGKVEFNLAVPFNLYMSELKINDVDYSDDLPDTYEELLAAFGGQHTCITVKVPVADSYTIETKVVDAKFDEDPNKTQLAIGNFLWFYDENACDDKNDMVKNAKLEIVSVEFNGVVYSGEDLFVGAGFPGSGLGEAKFEYMEWDENIKDGEIIDGKVVGGTVVNGEAVFPAGSIVTIKLIPDYGTQLVKLGVNNGNFDIDPDNMYYYTFEVGPGNFHLYATFEPVEDVVETSATAVSDGSISLGANSVDNGSAVLFVGDANLDNTTKTSFDNKAATESMEIASYLDISLDKVVYQGVGKDTAVNYSGDNKNVWSEELNDLSSPATVTLQLAEELDSTNVKVIHGKHDGTYEIIDAEYDPETKTVTFETSSFSNYAIAYEKNAPVTYYDLWVGGFQVTSANASNVLGDTGTPTVVYDADTNTLTLNGATITGLNSESLGGNDGDGGIVYSGTDDLTIEVTGGASTVTGGNTERTKSVGLLIGDPKSVFSASSNPCKTTIIIDEGASLTLVGGVPDSYSGCSVGLLCDSSGGLTITGSGTLNATGSGGGQIGVSEGIYTRNKLTIDGPTVNVSGAANSSVSVIVSVGIYSCGGVIINSGTVTTTAGYIDDYRDWSYGIKNTNNAITINGGTLTASGYSSALSMSPTLGEGVTASGSTNIDGSDAVPYSAADNDSCLWFNTSYTPLTYGISLDKTGTYTFTEATVGYSALTPVTVTVTNTGTGATGNLSVELSGSNPGCFTLSKTSLSGIAANGSDTFTIVPNIGLAPATYSTTVTVTGENNISATFKVSFKVNPVMYTVTITGGIADKETAAAGETVTVYADSIPEGKEFDKWVADSDDVVFYNASAEETNFTMPAEDVEITATFKDIKYTVTFNANGHGTAPAAQTVTSGSKATKPTDPTASGYTFGGWYTDSACTKAYSFDTAVTANITLYAKWTAVTTPAPSTPAPTNTTTPTPTPEPEIVPSAELIPSGTAHVQDVGDVPVSVDPETGIMTLGTTGQSKRLEEITIDFENTTGLSGTMEYRVHVQDIGWMDWTEAGNPAGTEGISKRIEAIEIRLTGELAEYYSVEYCVHIQDYGDMQGWVADGALAGTTGESKRIEQIKVRIVPKGSGDSMSVKYRVHIEDFGWEGSYASGGAMSGTSGQSKRLEAIEIFLTGGQYSGGIKYKTHVQDIGWESSYAQNGEMSGTQGQAKRLEGISIELYGEVAEYYDIYYRVHAQDIGWMGWAKNGEYAGTAGRSARLEGIQIVLVPKGGAAPGATYNGITAATDKAFIEGF